MSDSEPPPPPPSTRVYAMPGEAERVKRIRAYFEAEKRKRRAAFAATMAGFGILLACVLIALIGLATR